MADDNFIAGLEQALIKDTGAGFADALPLNNLSGGSAPPASSPPTTEPPVERKLTDPPIKGKAREHFKALEQSKRELEQSTQQQQQAWEQEKARLTAELETLKKGQASNEDQQELLRLREEVAALDVTRDPTFSARFEQPREIAITKAANLSGSRSADVKAVLSMEPGTLRDQRLQEILGELSPSVQAIVKAANEKVLALEFQRGVEIDTAKATWKTRAEQKALQQRAEQAKREQALPALVEAWKGTVDMLDTAKYPRAAQVIADATRFFKGDGLGPSEQAAVALQSAMFVPLSEEYDKAQTEIQTLREKLARYERSFPTGDGRGENQGTPMPRNADERIAAFNRGLDRAIFEDPTFSGARR